MTEVSLWTALITPLKEKGGVDQETLLCLINEQESSHNGIILMGSTGEGLLLTDQERREVLECVTKAPSKTPIFACICGYAIEEPLKRIEEYKRYGIQGLLILPPIYSRPGPNAQIKWFKQLLDAAEMPCILYNNPSRVGVSLSVDAIQAIADHPNLFGLKEASGSVDQWRVYRRQFPSLRLYAGNDDQIWELASEGATGLISAMSNIWPYEMHEYVRDCLKGRQVSPVWKRNAPVFCHNNPLSIKQLMAAIGRIPCANPKAPLDLLDATPVEELLKAYESMPSLGSMKC